jgi:hypothetical protein
MIFGQSLKTFAITFLNVMTATLYENLGYSIMVADDIAYYLISNEFESKIFSKNNV